METGCPAVTSSKDDISGLPCLNGREDAVALLRALRDGIRGVFGARLCGLYLYGSLVWGDFTPDVSDLDTMAAIADDVTERDVTALRHMHEELVRPDLHPALARWADRIEVQYVPIARLPRFREQPFLMANISPGEPIHLVEAGRDWLANWYFVQTHGVALYGLPPAEGARTDPMLTFADFAQAIREHALSWRSYVAVTAGNVWYQAYAVLTMCRALYTLTQGGQESKQAAADWAAVALPEHAELIREALALRVCKNPEQDPAAFHARVVAFVCDIADQIEGLPLPG